MKLESSDNELYEQLVELRTKKEELQSLLDQGRHECCDHLVLRTREFGGGKHFVNQCQQCGEQRGTSLSRKEALKLNAGVEPPLYDDSITIEREEHRSYLSKSWNNAHAEERRITALIHGWSFENVQYSFTQEQKQLKEANDRLSELLTEFEKEFGEGKVIDCLIKQTVSRKKRKYIERQNTTKRFSDEKELKSWFIGKFNRDFYIYEEVSGIHLAEGVNVRIDFVLYPRPHLIEEGFIDEPFGIEVKYFKQESGFTHKTSRGIWQAISYNDCLFNLNGHEFKIKFCLLFSNLSFSAETALIKNLGYEGENDQMEWSGMLHVANHARVGVLSVSGDKELMKGWVMRFAGGTYFSSSSYNNEVSYRRSNSNTINKIRIGNF
ncbi:hypothetical protein MED121_01450 [Marinomonas sp. MED121]|uniref:hypothetical protein n=1 Tax=Marinomonas sp. MED121 TaxID=314277 RepID=UPI0000690A89|nr:hypothetical protein [Marinomonas sp. MED121]EAQ65835.1 hypothetical protein MED121_01450 [Marinomonas sp. MED121]